MILTRRNLILAATAGIFVPKYGRWFNRLREAPRLQAPYTLIEESLDGGRTWREVTRAEFGVTTVTIPWANVPRHWTTIRYRASAVLPPLPEYTVRFS